MTDKWDSEAGQTHYDEEAERIAREKTMSKSILGDLKPKFWAYRLGSDGGYYITDNDGNSCDLVRICDILNAIPALEAERDEMKNNYEGACHTVALMHKAAMGEVCGPNRGVVEDVEDLRAERDALKADKDRLQQACDSLLTYESGFNKQVAELSQLKEAENGKTEEK